MDDISLMQFGKGTRKIIDLVSVSKNRAQLRKSFSRLEFKHSKEDRDASNIFKGMKEAVNEFVEQYGGSLEAAKNHRSEKNKVIIILTSHFDYEQYHQQDRDKLILKLHGLQISVIIFGIDLEKQIEIANEDDSQDDERKTKPFFDDVD